MNPFAWSTIAATLLYAALGSGLLAAVFAVFDHFIPTNIWDEVSKKGNVALAVFVGSFVIALGVIIAAVVG